MTAPLILFLFLGGLAIAFSLLVIFQRNVVYSAVSLVAALFAVAVLFLTLDAPMVGILQILVYAGAIMVLFLFVIMFLNPRELEQRKIFWWGLGSLGSFFLILAIVPLITAPAGVVTGEAFVTGSFGSPVMLAQSLFTDFILPFEIASVLLLVAIIGAVVLAKRGG
jgi:NADH-quinone oxidoreductase subunit J